MELTPERSVLLMVAALHRLGYERVRIAPGMAPSGLYWRCSIAPAARFHGRSARLARWDGAVAHYSSAQGAAYFDWPDAAEDPPEALARKFCQRFPEIARAGRGRDPAYAAWYQEMLRLTEAGALPIAYADWELPDGCLDTVGGPGPVRIPLPPPTGGGVREMAQRPDDFKLRYHWEEGSLPPPYHYELDLALEASGLGQVRLTPDYPRGGVPAFTEDFPLPPEAVDRLYREVYAAGLFEVGWRAQAGPPPGGEVEWLEVDAHGWRVEIPPFPLPEQAAGVRSMIAAARALVPPEAWERLAAQRRQYWQERGEQR